MGFKFWSVVLASLAAGCVEVDPCDVYEGSHTLRYTSNGGEENDCYGGVIAFNLELTDILNFGTKAESSVTFTKGKYPNSEDNSEYCNATVNLREDGGWSELNLSYSVDSGLLYGSAMLYGDDGCSSFFWVSEI